jgi:selenocysteine-specific elongation factor
VIIGTAGHIDHGKSALVRALTGVDTDRLKEEKQRGISIDLGFAYLQAPDGAVIGFIDVPGHEKFIHNMLAGATGIDFVLLTVAADDGVMPQTAEHLAILDLLDVTHGVVALTKADLVSAERCIELVTELESTLADTALADARIIRVSVMRGEGIADLRECLFTAARAITPRASSGRFRLAVDRSFTLSGVGTVVTGTVLSGVVSVGDRVTISPSGLSARVRTIHAQNRPAQRGETGQRCALNLVGDGVAKNAIVRGDMVLDPDLHAPTDRIDVVLRVLGSEQKPITQWMPVRLHHAASDVAARIVLLSDTHLPPGGESCVQIVLEHPIAAACGDHFVLRDTTAQRTIGGGRFLDLRAPARKRRTPDRLAQLDACRIADPDQALTALLDRAPWYVDLATFTRDRALAPSVVETIATRGEVIRIGSTQLGLSPTVWLGLKCSLAATLESFHAENPDLPGMGFERLRMQLQPRLPAPAFAAMLHGLSQMHEVALDGAWVRLPGHEVRLTLSDERLWSKVRPLIGKDERFRPPRVRDIAAVLGVGEADVRRLLKLLSRMGKVDEVAHDHFFLRGTVAEMVEIASDVARTAENSQFGAAEFRDRLHNGRKVAIQILEFFDRHCVTLRRGDQRRLNKHRLDLFRRPSDEAPLAQMVFGGESSPEGRPDFKSGKGREPVLGGFDSLSLPPHSARPR